MDGQRVRGTIRTRTHNFSIRASFLGYLKHEARLLSTAVNYTVDFKKIGGRISLKPEIFFTVYVFLL